LLSPHYFVPEVDADAAIGLVEGGAFEGVGGVVGGVVGIVGGVAGGVVGIVGALVGRVVEGVEEREVGGKEKTTEASLSTMYG
jgi:hypothetical protein